jgi:predicted nucleotidyltransferase
MKPSTSLEQQRSAVRAAAERFRTVNPRLLGSVVRGDDADASDIDLLVDPLPGATLLDLGGLQVELVWTDPLCAAPVSADLQETLSHVTHTASLARVS